jgi:hypothetical protein
MSTNVAKNSFTKQIKLAGDLTGDLFGGLVAIFIVVVAKSQNECSKIIILLQCKCSKKHYDSSKIISYCITPSVRKYKMF